MEEIEIVSEHPQACYYIVAKTPPPTGSTMHAVLVHGSVEMRREPVGPARGAEGDKMEGKGRDRWRWVWWFCKPNQIKPLS